MRKLPPLNAVRTFEAVARHKSISRAADELSVTHGAVSKQLKVLEEFLGEPLFERRPSGMAPTQLGSELAKRVNPPFVALEEAFSRLISSGRIKNNCRLTTVPSFASQFLVPRLWAFNDAHPHMNLQILTTARIVDFHYEQVDLAVRYGNGDWPDVRCDQLAGGNLIAVCAPGLIRKDEKADQLLLRTPLIHKNLTDEWPQWFRQVGLQRQDADAGLRFEDFNVAIKATLEGLGACLLPKILIQQELKCRRLIKLSEVELATELQYYVVCPVDCRKKAICDEATEWLCLESRTLFAEEAFTVS